MQNESSTALKEEIAPEDALPFSNIRHSAICPQTPGAASQNHNSTIFCLFHLFPQRVNCLQWGKKLSQTPTGKTIRCRAHTPPCMAPDSPETYFSLLSLHLVKVPLPGYQHIICWCVSMCANVDGTEASELCCCTTFLHR